MADSLPALFRTEGQALSFIRSRIAKGTIVNADEGSSWDALGAWEPPCRGIGISKILKKLQLHLAKAVIRWMPVLTVWAIPAEEDGARKVQ